ncbi:MAG: hypothetical protein RJA44_418, partial [Pseudomonadota bacterium]
MPEALARPWLQSYPPGVPAQIDTSRYASLVELLEAAFRRHPEREAARFMHHPLRYADLDVDSAALAAWLQSCDLAPGSRVALMMPNLPQYMVALAAVLRAG